MQLINFIVFSLMPISLMGIQTFSPLFGTTLIDQRFAITDATIDDNGRIAYCSGQQYSSQRAVLLKYNIVGNSSTFVSKSYGNDSIYIRIFNAGKYLLLKNNNSNTILFSKSTLSHIQTLNTSSIDIYQYIPSQSIFAYATITQQPGQVSYFNLNNINSTSIIIVSCLFSINFALSTSQSLLYINIPPFVYGNGSVHIWNTTAKTIINSINMGSNYYSAMYLSNNDTYIHLQTVNLSTIVKTNDGIHLTESITNIISPITPWNAFFSIYDGLGYAFDQNYNGLVAINTTNNSVTQLNQLNLPNANGFTIVMNRFYSNTYVVFSNDNMTNVTVYKSNFAALVCADAYFVNGNVCSACSTNCLNCSNASLCTLCSSAFTLNNGFCSCKLSQYFDNVTGSCLSCPDSCLVCKNENICLQLKDSSSGFFACSEYDMSNNRTLCASWEMNSVASSFATATTNLISTPFARQILHVFSPLFSFNDEYWFYVYHNRTYKNLIATVTFFDFLNQINSQRLTIPYIDFKYIQQKASFSSYFSSDYTNYTQQSVFRIDGNATYFVLDVEDLFTMNYIGLIAIFIILRVLRLITRIKAQNRGWFIGKLLKYVKEFTQSNSTYIILIRALIQSNVIIVAFYGIQNLFNSFFFQFSDKINIIICLVSFFICLVYSFSFYPLIFRFFTKISLQILEKQKLKRFNYIFEAPLQVLKSFVMGVIHSGLLKVYTFQMITILLIKLILAVAICCNTKCFRHKIIFVFSFILLVVEVLFNLMLLSSYFLYELNTGALILELILAYHSQFEVIALFCFIGIVFIKIIANCFISAYQKCTKQTENDQKKQPKSVFKSNRVQDIGGSKSAGKIDKKEKQKKQINLIKPICKSIIYLNGTVKKPTFLHRSKQPQKNERKDKQHVSKHEMTTKSIKNISKEKDIQIKREKTDIKQLFMIKRGEGS